MRIALMPSAFAPRVGGVEILTDRLARSMQRAGHEVQVWTARTRGDDLREDEWIDGLRVRRFAFDAPRAHIATAALWPVRALMTLRRLQAARREFRPELLHVQCFSGNGVYATLLSVVSRTPMVVTLQGETFGDDQDIYGRSLYLRTGLRVGLRRARRVTACSQYALDDVAARFDPSVREGRVIFNGIDEAEMHRDDWRPPFDRFVFALGRVVYGKGFDLLIQAWSHIAERHPDVGLVIGGDGPDLPRLRSIATDLSLHDRIFFAGGMSKFAVIDAMRDADVFVMPSRAEAFGIVALEAWRAGTPAVVTARGGPSEFIEDGVSGLVVDPLDVNALAERIGRLLGDADLRARLAAAGTAQLGAFGWPEITRQYEEVYESALDGARRRT